MFKYMKIVRHILQENTVKRKFKGIKKIKRIFDDVVRAGGQETQGFIEADKLIDEEGWELLGFEALGDHLIWVLGKPRK